ncbi:MAG: hypothetical protein U0V70_17895 [Terriglobia bacterium]
MKALAQGQYVKHFQYGCGVITESNEARTSIKFDDHGIKKFVTSMMVVEPAEQLAPPPKRTRATAKRSTSLKKKKVAGS